MYTKTMMLLYNLNFKHGQAEFKMFRPNPGPIRYRSNMATIHLHVYFCFST